MNDTKTVSGAIVHVTDADEAPLVKCLVDIVPKQSGSGTPSPDNVRTISGWESVSVKQTGKNLFDKSVMAKNWYITGSNTIGNGGTCLLFSVPIGVTFTVSGTNGGRNRLLASDKPYNELVVGDTLTSLSNTNLPLQLTSQYRTYIYYCETSFNQAIADSIQIELGNTATAYEPYNGTTTPVNLGRTVYGGTLDVVSGELTAYPFYPSYNGETLNGRWVCDRAVYAEGTTPPTGSQVALISGTGATYQLTPTEVSTLLGENNVWANSGDIEITYHTDTLGIYNKIYINGRPYFRPNDFEVKREDVYAGEYTTCTGKLIADKIGWKYSDLPMKWDILPDEDLVYLTTLTGAFNLIFRDSDGQHTEQVIRKGFTNTPTRITGPEGSKIWTGIEMEVTFLNTHPIDEE